MSLPIWEGYPHSTSILRSNGIERVTDYHPVNLPTPNLLHASEFITPDCPGFYIRWMNSSRYWYWLFSNVGQYSVKTKSLGSITNHWRVRTSAVSRVHNIGKTSKPEIDCSSKVKKEYMRELTTLLDSPEVYLYTDNMPLTLPVSNCGWVKVQLRDGTFKTLKSDVNTTEFKIKIMLPEYYTTTII